jgi:hypothetical protein
MVAVVAVDLFAPVAIALAAVVIPLAVIATTVLSVFIALVPNWLLCLSSPSSLEEVSVIALITLVLIGLAFFVALVVVIFNALAVAVSRYLLSAAMAHPLAARLLSADAGGASAASCPPAEPLLPLVALHFIMADCFLIKSAKMSFSHWRSRRHRCHCIMIFSCLATLTEESFLKKEKAGQVFLFTAQELKKAVQIQISSKSRSGMIAHKNQKRITAGTQHHNLYHQLPRGLPVA